MFSHQPVMVNEIISALNILENGIYVDATFGRGGHSQQILNRLSNGKLICFDKDPEAINYGARLFGQDPRVTLIHGCFSEIFSQLSQLNLVGKINGILFDLGVCSIQLDQDDRGFSFMRQGPLDMRMNPQSGIDAASWISVVSKEELAAVLKNYGEEPFAKKIATRIVKRREIQPITTTTELVNIITECVPSHLRRHHPATKTFQAIRIHINQELIALEKALEAVQGLLAPNGRCAMISFHSLEDRRVKRFFQAKTKVTLPKGIGIPERQLKAAFRWVAKRTRAAEDEVENNSRARSAVMRVIEKCE